MNDVIRRALRAVALTVISATLVGSFAVSNAQASTGKMPNASRSTVRFLEKRWGLIETPDANVSDIYEESAAGSSQAVSDKNAMLTRYVLPVSADGIKIKNVRVYPRDVSERITGKTATVTGLIDVEFENHQPGVAEPIITREANIPFTVQLRQQGKSWRVWAASFADTWANPSDGDIIADASLDPVWQQPVATQSAFEVVPMGFYTYYNRANAAAYANTWWNRRNSAYRSFPNDCANFVSQSFRGGSAQMAWVSPYFWWYNNKGTSSTSDDTWHYAWSVAHDQAYNLSRNSDYSEMRGTYVSSAGALSVGDSIYYELTGDTAILDHSAIVVKVVNGVPYVNYHTTDTYQRHWNLGARSTKFLHVTDSFFN